MTPRPINKNPKLHFPIFHQINQDLGTNLPRCENCTSESYTLRNRQIPKRTPHYQKQTRHRREIPVNVTPLPREVFRSIGLADTYASYDIIEDHITDHLNRLAVSDPSWAITNFDNYWPQHAGLKQYWAQQLQILRRLQSIVWPDAWHKSTQNYLNPNRGLGTYQFPITWWYHIDSGIYFPPQIDPTNVLPSGAVFLPGHEHFDARDIRVEWFNHSTTEETRRNSKFL